MEIQRVTKSQSEKYFVKRDNTLKKISARTINGLLASISHPLRLWKFKRGYYVWISDEKDINALTCSVHTDRFALGDCSWDGMPLKVLIQGINDFIDTLNTENKGN